MTTQSAVSPRFPAGAVFIDGGVRDGVDGATFEHVNPAAGSPQWKGVLPGPADLDEVVRSCQAARAEWCRTPPEVRGVLLERAAAVAATYDSDLAALATAEAGVPAAVARNTAARPAALCRYYAGWADKVEGEVMAIFPKAGFDYTRLEPYGTVAIMVPWRNPLLAAAAQASAALAAGNCVVLMPSPLAPFTSLRLAELFAAAGVPPGVLNVLPGDVEMSERLAAHGGINKVAITAPRPVARRVMKAAARRLTPVTVQVGGPAGHIVFDDADLAVATQAVVTGAFVTPTGPGLAPPARLLAAEAISAELDERLVAAAGALVVGDPADPATQVGPVIDAATCRQTEAVASRAARDGLLVAGGERLGGVLSGGFFLSPALIRQPPGEGDAAPDEVGGPVLLMSRFGRDDEALALADGSADGFSGGVYTGELGRAHRLAAGLTSGSITVNGCESWLPGAPVGRQGGRTGLLEFVRTKNVFVDLSI